MPDRKRINVNIPMSLYLRVNESTYNLTDAVTEGLTLLLSGSSNNDIVLLANQELQASNDALLKELEDLRNKESENKGILQANELKIKELQDQIKLNDSLQDRIEDMKTQFQAFYAQLHTKDLQIEKLTETMQAQAVHLQTVLNQKAIEAPGSKKPWWQFW
jgi:chromosome segregation ATPase